MFALCLIFTALISLGYPYAMSRILITFLFCSVLVSCGTTKTIAPRDSSAQAPKENSASRESSHTNHTNSTKADQIVDFAKGYLGTKYRYGGTTNAGMDCSGLIYTSFINAGDIFLPRTTKELANEGKRISKRQIQKGDLLFFRTAKLKRAINHVGLVIDDTSGNIKFIHASTSKGVMVSQLDEAYWSKAFAKAQRVL